MNHARVYLFVACLVLAVQALGAYPILAPESGIHVLEEQAGEYGIRR